MGIQPKMEAILEFDIHKGKYRITTKNKPYNRLSVNITTVQLE